jgi:predicted N-acetyltransferase YhbS
MRLRFSTAIQADAPALAALHTAANEDLARRYGQGPWSSVASEKGAPFAMRHSRVLVARKGKRIVGTLILQTKMPWAIDVSYFTPVKKALYLTSMAVIPALQHQGVGRLLLEEAIKQTRKWPAASTPGMLSPVPVRFRRCAATAKSVAWSTRMRRSSTLSWWCDSCLAELPNSLRANPFLAQPTGR